MIFYEEPSATLYQGHAPDILKGLSSGSVDCVMTSSPYWGLRTYKTEPIIWGDNHCEHEWGNALELPPLRGGSKATASEKQCSNTGTVFAMQSSRPAGNFCLKCNAWRGELGLEPTIELYISHLIQIFNEVKRVLKKTGTCWIVIDDSYAGSNQGSHTKVPTAKQASNKGTNYMLTDEHESLLAHCGITPKSLCLIPQRFALAMVEQGWILRNDIVWNKPNPMPESVKDRFTGSWEHLFFFVRNKRYFFEQQFEKWTDSNIHDLSRAGKYIKYDGKWGNDKSNRAVVVGDPLMGRNKRDVWEITTQPYPEAHFATFPEKLCEIPILAGCPDAICKKCGKAREKIYDFETIWRKRPNEHVSYQGETLYGQPNQKKAGARPIDKGYTDCGCNAGFEPGTVLDPFCGSGTVLAVAKRLGRKGIGIDISPGYCKLTVKRIQGISMPMELV